MIQNYLDIIQEKTSQRTYAKQGLIKWKKVKKKAINHLEHLEHSRKIIQKAAQTTQKYLSSQMSIIVSNALKTVFQEEAYQFKIDFVKRRNSTECDLLFTKDGKDMHPLNSCGYGSADIASLALRIAYWKLGGETRNTMILDEPTRNLSLDKQPLAGLIIKQLAESFNLQFIIVTHNQALTDAADKVFRVSAHNNISKVSFQNKTDMLRR